MKNKQGGFIKWLILLVIAFILASAFFDFNLKNTIEDEQTQSNIQYLTENVSEFYVNYLAEKVDYVWNDIFMDLIWDNFVKNMTNVKTGEPSSLESIPPVMVIPE